MRMGRMGAVGVAVTLCLAWLVDCRAENPLPAQAEKAPREGASERGEESFAAREATMTKQDVSAALSRASFANPDGRISTFLCEVAATPDARATGLMNRRNLAPGHGMVFVFPYPEPQGFWMKNTYIALDMIFIGADGVVVGVVENARPLTLDLRGVSEASQFVVELPAFSARDHGIGPGTRVGFDPPLPVVNR